MPIAATRALLNAALDGSLHGVEYRRDTFFGFDVPRTCPGVDSLLLDPRATWPDADRYDGMARKLVAMFVENFAQFEAHVEPGVLEAAPRAA
jgi:phosphoenolpyruvate carboxykinase (ATP)